jgi:hypothetical protein
VVAYLESLIAAMDNLKDVNIKMNEIISISNGFEDNNGWYKKIILKERSYFLIIKKLKENMFLNFLISIYIGKFMKQKII